MALIFTKKVKAEENGTDLSHYVYQLVFSFTSYRRIFRKIGGRPKQAVEQWPQLTDTHAALLRN
jgi:hypothetical protein